MSPYCYPVNIPVAVITVILIHVLVTVTTAPTPDTNNEASTQLQPITNSSVRLAENNKTLEFSNGTDLPPLENTTLDTTYTREFSEVTIWDISTSTMPFPERSSLPQTSPKINEGVSGNKEESLTKSDRTDGVGQMRNIKDDIAYKVDVTPVDRKGQLDPIGVTRDEIIDSVGTYADKPIADDDDIHSDAIISDIDLDYDDKGLNLKFIKSKFSKRYDQEEPEEIIFQSDLDVLQQQLKYQNQELTDLRMRLSKSDIALINIESKFYKYLQTESLESDSIEHKRNILLTQRFPGEDTKLKKIPGIIDCQHSLSREADFLKLEQNFENFRHQVEDNLSLILKELDNFRSWRHDLSRQTTEMTSTEVLQNLFQQTSMSSEKNEKDPVKDITKIYAKQENISFSDTMPVVGTKYNFSNLTTPQIDNLVDSEQSFNITLSEKTKEFADFESVLPHMIKKIDSLYNRLDKMEGNMIISVNNVSQILSLSQQNFNGNITFLQSQINHIIARLDLKQNHSEVNSSKFVDSDVSLEMKTFNNGSYNDTTDKHGVLSIENRAALKADYWGSFNFSVNEGWNSTGSSEIDETDVHKYFISELLTVKHNFSNLYSIVENIDTNYADISLRVEHISHQLSSIVTQGEKNEDHETMLFPNKLSVKSKSVSGHLDALNEDYEKDIPKPDFEQNIGLKTNESTEQSTPTVASNVSVISQNEPGDKLLKWIYRIFFKNKTADGFLTHSDISETGKASDNILCYNFTEHDKSNSEANVSFLKTFLDNLEFMLAEVKKHLSMICPVTNRTSNFSTSERENISEYLNVSKNITFLDKSLNSPENFTHLSPIQNKYDEIKESQVQNDSILHNVTSHSKTNATENKLKQESIQAIFSFGDLENKTLHNNFSELPQTQYLESIYSEIESLSLRIVVLENRILSPNTNDFTNSSVNKTIPSTGNDDRGSGSLSLESVESDDALQNIISNLTKVQSQLESLNTNVYLQDKQLSSMNIDIFKLDDRLEHIIRDSPKQENEDILLDVKNAKNDISKLYNEMSEVSRHVRSFIELNMTETLGEVKCRLEDHETDIRDIKEKIYHRMENISLFYPKRKPTEEKIMFIDITSHTHEQGFNKTNDCNKMKTADRIFFNEKTHTCYYAFNSSRNLLPYHTAKKRCEEAGLHLLYTETEDERRYVTEEITKVIGTHWIGAERLGSRWFWVHGCEAIDPVINIPWRYNHSVPYLRALVWADKWLGAGSRRHARYVCEDEQIQLDSCHYSQNFKKIKSDWTLSARQQDFKALHMVDCGRLCLANARCQGFCFQKWGKHTCTLYGEKKHYENKRKVKCHVSEESCYIRDDDCTEQ
ncbi:uncharacterized protein LOC115228917 [Argonauta hians]